MITMGFLFRTSVQMEMKSDISAVVNNSAQIATRGKRVVLSKCCENNQAYDIIKKRCINHQNIITQLSWKHEKRLSLGN